MKLLRTGDAVELRYFVPDTRVKQKRDTEKVKHVFFLGIGWDETMDGRELMLNFEPLDGGANLSLDPNDVAEIK